MSARVGMPVMKLDRLTHDKKDKRSGNARAVALEALEERRSSDNDLNTDKTCENIYFGITSGNELVNYWEQMADSHRVVDDKGRERKLRLDAGIGFTGICKPDETYMNTLTHEEQVDFLMDTIDIIKEIYTDRGMLIDAVVIHFDERNPHIHYFGHDPEYKLGKKLGLPLFKALNKLEYPPKMKKRGWNVDELVDYDLERTKSMSEDELREYKKKHIEEKKEKHRKSSKEYKIEKDIETATKIKKDAEQAKLDLSNESRRLETWENSLKMQSFNQHQREIKLKRYERECKERFRRLKDQENILNEREMKLSNKGINQDIHEAEIRSREEYLLEWEEDVKKQKSKLEEEMQRYTEICMDNVRKQIEEKRKKFEDWMKAEQERIENQEERNRRLIKLGQMFEMERKLKDNGNQMARELKSVNLDSSLSL